MNIEDVKVGIRVRAIGGKSKGLAGTVFCTAKRDYFGIVFDDFTEGHNLWGSLISGSTNGWFMRACDFEPMEESKDKPKEMSFRVGDIVKVNPLMVLGFNENLLDKTPSKYTSVKDTKMYKTIGSTGVVSYVNNLNRCLIRVDFNDGKAAWLYKPEWLDLVQAAPEEPEEPEYESLGSSPINISIGGKEWTIPVPKSTVGCMAPLTKRSVREIGCSGMECTQCVYSDDNYFSFLKSLRDNLNIVKE